MGYHPEYLEVFLRAHHLLMHGDGPLAFNVRVYIAILVSTILQLLPIWAIIAQGTAHVWIKFKQTCIYGNNCPCVLGIIWVNLYNPCYQMSVMFSGGEGSLAVAVLNFKSCCTSHVSLCDHSIEACSRIWCVIGRHKRVPILNFPYCNHVINLIAFACVTSCLQLLLLVQQLLCVC